MLDWRRALATNSVTMSDDVDCGGGGSECCGCWSGVDGSGAVGADRFAIPTQNRIDETSGVIVATSAASKHIHRSYYCCCCY